MKNEVPAAGGRFEAWWIFEDGSLRDWIIFHGRTSMDAGDVKRSQRMKVVVDFMRVLPISVKNHGV